MAFKEIVKELYRIDYELRWRIFYFLILPVVGVIFLALLLGQIFVWLKLDQMSVDYPIAMGLFDISMVVFVIAWFLKRKSNVHK